MQGENVFYFKNAALLIFLFVSRQKLHEINLSIYTFIDLTDFFATF